MSDAGDGRRQASVDRRRWYRSRSLVRGGTVGIALVTAATGGLVAAAALIAAIVAALY